MPGVQHARALLRRVWVWSLRRRVRINPALASWPVPQAPVDAPPVAPARDAPAVNVYGFLSGSLGLGQIARLYRRALLRAGVEVRSFDVTVGPGGLQCKGPDVVPAPARDVINLVFVNPDRFDELRPWLDAQPSGQRHYTIAMWFWELPTLPASWSEALAQVDEVWVATSFVKAAFEGRTARPVMLMPPPLAPVSAKAPADRHALGLPTDAYVFLYVFDFNSTFVRKNPCAVIDAFLAAFPAGDENVRLLVKSSNGLHYPALLHALLRRAGRDRRILIRDAELDRGRMHVLQASCDAYVSLHRAEGLGLTIAEAMALGQPVIATNWSGNTDFMGIDNSIPVAYALVPVAAGQYPGDVGGVWAEPDIAAAARAMRWMADNPADAVELGRTARAAIESTLGEQRVGELMVSRLKEVARTS